MEIHRRKLKDIEKRKGLRSVTGGTDEYYFRQAELKKHMFQIDQAGNILDLLVNLYFCSQDALNRTVEPENTEKAHGNTGGQWFTTWQEYIES